MRSVRLLLKWHAAELHFAQFGLMPCQSYCATAGTDRYSTELYGWQLQTGATTGPSGKTQLDPILVKASSTALDFSSLPTPPGGRGDDGTAAPSASPRPATSIARARQVLDRSCARDWAAAPQPEVVAEVEKLQALLGGLIAAAEPALGPGGAALQTARDSSAQEGRGGERGEQPDAGDVEEEEGWSVTRLLFG